jgi:hypothetical protein
MSKIYYVNGNTAEGCVNLLDSNIKNLKNVFVLKHASDKLKTEVIKKLMKSFESRETEILLSANGEKYLDGIILREKSTAILIDQVAKTDMDNVKIIELGTEAKQDVQRRINKSTQAAYEDFATGLAIHDKLEKLYIDQMDFTKADQLAAELIEKLLHDQIKSEKEGYTYHRLFGTNTSDGVVNVVPSLLEEVSNCYFLKGRAGTGKSTFMKKIAKACTDHGYDIELYHCSFDPGSIDMVLVPDLDFCIFDSTDPHEFFPERDGDVVIDLYKEAVNPGTDEKFADEINALNGRYKSYMKKGIKNLKEAGFYRDQMEEKYALPDEVELRTVVDKLMNEI